jgi:hypothetical protein
VGPEQRHVGRAAVRRVVARARPHQARHDPSGGPAASPDEHTRLVRRGAPTDPVFVDQSGRRSRAVRRVAYWLVAIALLLLAALWLSQAVGVVGGPEAR